MGIGFRRHNAALDRKRSASPATLRMRDQRAWHRPLKSAPARARKPPPHPHPGLQARRFSKRQSAGMKPRARQSSPTSRPPSTHRRQHSRPPNFPAAQRNQTAAKADRRRACSPGPCWACSPRCRYRPQECGRSRPYPSRCSRHTSRRQPPPRHPPMSHPECARSSGQTPTRGVP